MMIMVDKLFGPSWSVFRHQRDVALWYDKGKDLSQQAMKACGGLKVYLRLFLTSALGV